MTTAEPRAGMHEEEGKNPAPAKVAIITRTKNRNLLLARAAQSVGKQSFGDYIWTVVNDGGDEAGVRRVLENGSVAPERIALVSRATSLGMEAASNAGIATTRSDYIVILDDDDSWEPEFLARTVAFLESPAGSRYGGVVTHSTYVSEMIRGDEVVILARKPYQDQLRTVDLDAMLERNLFPTMSFLFRRTVCDQVGGFDPSLPVLGDWNFNLEFLLRADIAVLPEPLANYHHRARSGSTAPEYRNTVVEKLALHQEYTALVRNDFLRRNLSQSAVAFRLALQGSVHAPAAAERREGPALAPMQALARGDNDLTWTISAINAALANRSPRALVRNRKLSPLPPNATWSLVLPLLQRLGVVVPPPPDFDEGAYLRANPDVAAEVASGGQPSGFMHFLNHGRHEGRARTNGEYAPPVEHHVVHADGGHRPVSPNRPVFDSAPMQRFSHAAPGFDKVLHVAHHEWHGIRQATAYSPGHKLLISAHEPLEIEGRRAIAEQIARMGIARVCFQGYSHNADALLLHLRAALGPAVKYYAISHVTTAQFDHRFEMEVIARLLGRLRFGVLDGLASVKPGFGQAFDGFWHGTIINHAPNLPMPRGRRGELAEVYVPLDVGWRKNLFTNIIAASLASNVDIVKTANFPDGLEDIHDLRKLRLVGYLRGQDLFDEMARSSLTLNATLAECQPMTQLESLAVGTPALTGPLPIEEFDGDPLIALCTTSHLDNPALIARDIGRILGVLETDPAAMEQMIVAHLATRHAVAARNLAEFLRV